MDALKQGLQKLRDVLPDTPSRFAATVGVTAGSDKSLRQGLRSHVDQSLVLVSNMIASTVDPVELLLRGGEVEGEEEEGGQEEEEGDGEDQGLRTGGRGVGSGERSVGVNDMNSGGRDVSMDHARPTAIHVPTSPSQHHDPIPPPGFTRETLYHLSERGPHLWEFQLPPNLPATHPVRQLCFVRQHGRLITILRKPRSVQTNLPVPSPLSFQRVFYFEILILHLGLAWAGIGLDGNKHAAHVPAPGFQNDAVGLWSNGRVMLPQLLKDKSFPKSGIRYSPKFGEGDTVGCGVMPREKGVFFTLNGKRLRVLHHEVGEVVYPTVGASDTFQCVVNFGEKRFRWEPANEYSWGYMSDPLPKYMTVERGSVNQTGTEVERRTLNEIGHTTADQAPPLPPPSATTTSPQSPTPPRPQAPSASPPRTRALTRSAFHIQRGFLSIPNTPSCLDHPFRDTREPVIQRRRSAECAAVIRKSVWGAVWQLRRRSGGHVGSAEPPPYTA